MPSKAYKTFQYNLIDASRLIDAYHELSAARPRQLGHISRGIVVSLCASWEQYIEDVVIELVDTNIENHRRPHGLPKSVQKTIVKSAQRGKHDLSVLDLTGDGWREVYSDAAEEAVDKFHSPNSERIADLFRDYIGITDPVWECWSLGKEHMDAFIDVRHRLVHKGRSAGRYIQFEAAKHHTDMIPVERIAGRYIPFKAAKRSNDNIKRTAMETDDFLYTQFIKIFPMRPAPWEGTAK